MYVSLATYVLLLYFFLTWNVSTQKKDKHRDHYRVKDREHDDKRRHERLMEGDWKKQDHHSSRGRERKSRKR